MACNERMVSANKLIILLAKRFRNKGMVHYDDLMAAIADVPTVDAVEVVHGRWEYWKFDVYKCSNCDGYCNVAEVMGKPAYDYCPNCGAKMDGGNEDGNQTDSV